MDLGRRYLGSKGVRDHRQEDGVLGSLGPPGDLEESVSHHFPNASILGALPLGEGGGAKLSPLTGAHGKMMQKMIKNQVF